MIDNETLKHDEHSQYQQNHNSQAPVDAQQFQHQINDSIKLNSNEIVYLFETFYISTKKNCTFQVKLTNDGICLRKDNGNNNPNGSATKSRPKEQKILLKDIIGCKCQRTNNKKFSKKTTSCVGSCTTASPTHAINQQNGDYNNSSLDSSAYLHIYAYVLKKNRHGVNSKRERTTLTLRFRSFDQYTDNEAEAQKWKHTISKLIRNDVGGSANDMEKLNKIKSSIELTETDRADGVFPSAFHETGANGNSNSTGTHAIINQGLSDINNLKKILIFLNPKSGQGKGREIFQQRIIPLFMESEVTYELQLTKYKNYARDYLRQCPDITSWKKIIVIGGDGIFFEVINGVMEREDWEAVLRNTTFGIIPTGSGNGLARSIAHMFNEPYESNPILSSTLAVIKGKTTPIDFIRIETKSKIMYSVLSVGWGLISDIDIESERLRTIGYQRFTLWSIHRLINLRTYKGRISYIKIDLSQYKKESGTIDAQNKLLLKHSKSLNTALDFAAKIDKDDDIENFNDTLDFDDDVISLETTNPNGSYQRPRLDSWYSTVSKKSTYFSTTESIYQSVSDFQCTKRENSENIQVFGPSSNIPAITTTDLPNEWTIEEGDYILVHAAYQTHLGSDCHFAPSAALNDGIIWLAIIRGGVSRSQLLSFLLGLSSGTHLANVHQNQIEMIPVKAFRIEPFNTEGHITVDGEVVEYGPIQGEIYPSLANCLVPDCSI